ncbi:MAG: MobF family relaxase [Arcobacteraceae bacterium]
MLARPKIATAQGARNYFEKDTYYLNNEFEQGSFYGKLKDDLGLTDFNLEDFDSLLKAENPQTKEKLLNLQKKDLDENGDRKRAALDLTFAADKSISILYEIASESEKAKIREAFNKSIDTALDYVEANYSTAKSRSEIKGDNTAQNKLLFTRFDHSESRDNDMHLHQHCLMMNFVQDKNGKYKSMEFNQTMLNHQLIGQIQRNELAKNLQKMGIETEILDVKVGSFKAKNVSQELREEFSQRSKAIKEEMEKSGQTSYKASHTAQKQTAKWKDKNKDRMQIQEDNISKLKFVGADIEQLKQTKENLQIRNMTATTAVDIALEDITDKQSVFKKEDIYKHALKVALTTDLSIEDIVKEFESQKELITINKEKNQYTTLEVLQKEEYIFSLKDEKNFSITDDKEIVNQAIKDFEADKGFELKKGQVELAHTILESDSQIVIAQGVAGAGKSTSLEIVKSVAELSDRKIVALAPTGTAANNLAKEAGIKESYTVAKFLQTNGNDVKDALVIVDEAGMMGLRDTHDLLKIAKENNLKIVFSGDKNQKKSISQGDIFPGMQRNGFSTVYLNEGNRQKTDKMRNAVKNILDKDITSALGILKDTTKEIKKTDDRLLAAKTEYLKDRHNSLLITTTNTDRKQLNKDIRDFLVSTGEVTNTKTFQTRETPSLSDLEKRSYLHYSLDQKLFLSKNIGSITAGREAKIIDINAENNTIKIEHTNRKNTFVETVDLSKNGNSLNQFIEDEKEFGIGDQLIAKKGDKKVGVTNGMMGTIININGDNITVQFDKEEVTINTNEYKYLDHAYAITDFASQGKTTNKVIAVANSQAASFNDFYTQITRAKFEAFIFTDNLEDLLQRAANESEKLNASELIKQYQEQNNIKTEDKIMTKKEYTENISKLDITKLQEKELEILDMIANEEAVQEQNKKAKLEVLQKKAEIIQAEIQKQTLSQNEIAQEHNIKKDNLEDLKEEEKEEIIEELVEKGTIAKLASKYENVDNVITYLETGEKVKEKIVEEYEKTALENLKSIKIDDVKNVFSALNQKFKEIDIEDSAAIFVAVLKSAEEVAKNKDITLLDVAQKIVQHQQEQKLEQNNIKTAERGM